LSLDQSVDLTDLLGLTVSIRRVDEASVVESLDERVSGAGEDGNGEK